MSEISDVHADNLRMEREMSIGRRQGSSAKTDTCRETPDFLATFRSGLKIRPHESKLRHDCCRNLVWPLLIVLLTRLRSISERPVDWSFPPGFPIDR